MYSSGKSIAAIVVAMLVDQGLLSYDEKIASMIISFWFRELLEVIVQIRSLYGCENITDAMINPFKFWLRFKKRQQMDFYGLNSTC